MRGVVLLILLAACGNPDVDEPVATSGGARQEPYVAVPPGTAPRGTVAFNVELAPPGPPVTPALLQRGADGYAVYCTPCHGPSGYGDGPVVRRGFPPPPPFHAPAQRTLDAERIVAVITNGYGAMYPYAERIPPAERWAIARHVKALQASAP